MEAISRFLIKNKKYIYIFIILLCGIVLSIPLFNKNIDVFRDDGIQHVIRIDQTAKALRSGESFKVYYDLYNSFGYSWDIFYGNFTSVVPAFFCLIFGFSAISSFKIFLGLLILLSGFTMYIAMIKMFDNREIGLVSAILYMCAPYHLNDIYIRFAIGETAAFVFIPLVFAGLDSIIKNKKSSFAIAYLVIGASGLIISHLLSTIITAFFCLIYLIMHINNIKEDFGIIRKLLVALIITSCLTSYMWVPLMEHTIFEKYQVYEDGMMANSNLLNKHRVDIKNLFTSKNYFQIHELGVVIIALSILSIWVYIKKKIDKEYLKVHIIFLVFGIVSIIITSKIINWTNVPKMFYMIQFPWRMFEFSSFFLSVVSAVSFYYFMKDFKIKDAIFIVLIVMIFSINYKDRIRYKSNPLKDPSIGIVREESLYKTNAGCAKYEYLPVKAYKNMKYVTSREKGIILSSNDVSIIEEKKVNGVYRCKFITDKENIMAELPYVYYRGYSIRVNGTSIEYKENDNGFIEVELNELKDENEIQVEYTGTMFGISANILSIISVFVFIGTCIYYKKKLKV